MHIYILKYVFITCKYTHTHAYIYMSTHTYVHSHIYQGPVRKQTTFHLNKENFIKLITTKEQENLTLDKT